jgi:hypothetical protein
MGSTRTDQGCRCYQYDKTRGDRTQLVGVKVGYTLMYVLLCGRAWHNWLPNHYKVTVLLKLACRPDKQDREVIVAPNYRIIINLGSDIKQRCDEPPKKRFAGTNSDNRYTWYCQFCRGFYPDLQEPGGLDWDDSAYIGRALLSHNAFVMGSHRTRVRN